MINRSTDGRYLFLTGYEADVNQTPLAGSLASAVPRVVGRIAADGTIDTSTVIPDLDDGTGTNSGSPRGVISTNGTDLWVTGAEGGVRYTTLGNTAATTQINADITNLRHIDIFNEQLYVSTMSGPTVPDRGRGNRHSDDVWPDLGRSARPPGRRRNERHQSRSGPVLDGGPVADGARPRRALHC